MPFIPFSEMPAHSRLWIYQTDRLLNEVEIQQVTTQIQQFVNQWTSHQNALRASGEFLHGYFLILAVDEQSAGASGCSIDKSVAFVQSLEKQLAVDFFNRWNFIFAKNNQLHLADKTTFADLYQNAEIDANTLVFNNLIAKKADLETNWQVPIAKSWHARFV